MFSIILKRTACLGAILAILAAVAGAQTAQVEGNVKVKAADGTLKPVAGALIDIYRLDVKGHWDVKTDKSGHFVRLGMPLQGTYLFVASGPGIQPTWTNNVKITQVPSIDMVANEGDGSTLTLEQVQAAIKSGGAAQPTGPTKAAPTADRAKLEAEKKDYEAKLKEGQALQATFDSARTHYNAGIELTKGTPPNYAAALSEFEAATAIDPGKHAAMAELAYKANANLAESHYQIGVDMFNKKDRAGAKPHFEKAVEASNKAIAIASGAAESNPNVNNDLLIYYNILAKNAQLLVEFYGAANMIDDTVKSLDKAASMDAANKNKWGVAKADMYRAAGRTDDAVAAYKAVIATDPNNTDALYGLGLTLIASSERAQIQEGADTLALFASKAPATDKRVPIVKEALEGVKNAYKIEAEKPSSRGRRKP
ncbi:MAG TPA: tetratricopeptide repeat protein [Blastocatellia bacterium]|jgi:tetratricopeptide (TPR) repeat protein|nr:tetratricopeptide repeat protein [Blastocatellia bacterium]